MSLVTQSHVLRCFSLLSSAGQMLFQHLLLWLLLLCVIHINVSTHFLSTINVPKSLLFADDLPPALCFCVSTFFQSFTGSFHGGSEGRALRYALSSPTVEARVNNVFLSPNQNPHLSAGECGVRSPSLMTAVGLLMPGPTPEILILQVWM